MSFTLHDHGIAYRNWCEHSVEVNQTKFGTALKNLPGLTPKRSWA